MVARAVDARVAGLPASGCTSTVQLQSLRNVDVARIQGQRLVEREHRKECETVDLLLTTAKWLLCPGVKALLLHRGFEENLTENKLGRTPV